MNVWLSLDPDEVEALMNYHAEKIGHRDEAESDRARKRIEQLNRSLHPDLLSDEWSPPIEGIAA